MNMKLNFIPLVSGMVACATVLTAQPITRNIITTNANPSFVAGVAAGGGTVTETNTTTRRVAIHINTNVVNALAAAEAAKTTNGLGSAAWEAVEDFDASGAAQNATNGLNEALAPQIASKLATNGSGSGLTALNATELTLGTIPDVRLSTNGSWKTATFNIYSNAPPRNTTLFNIGTAGDATLFNIDEGGDLVSHGQYYDWGTNNAYIWFRYPGSVFMSVNRDRDASFTDF